FILYYVSFILMIPAYFIFELNALYLALLFALLLLFLITKKIEKRKNYSGMLKIARLIISLFGFAITISITKNIKLIILGSTIIFFFLEETIKKLIKYQEIFS
ncbi:MAG TPA: hypothetical protein VJ895_01530, partial [Candidatus Nanoarchaeia archaeon]|nr:hypothetical protein [Candidatus Nanoarchaeia archaeon]